MYDEIVTDIGLIAEFEAAKERIAQLESLLEEKEIQLKSAENLIDDYKKAEEINLRNQKFLTEIIDNIPVNIILKEAKTYKYIIWNKNCEKELGILAEEAFGKTDFDFFPQEQAENFLSTDKETIRKKKVVSIAEQTINSRLYGSLIYNTIKVPILFNNEESEYILVFSINITNRKTFEKQLRKSERKYRFLFEEAPIGIFKTTIEGRFTDLNSSLAEMFGYLNIADLQNSIKNISEDLYVQSDKRKEIIELLKNDTKPKKFELLFKRKDGSVFTGDLTCKMIFDNDNKPKSIFGFVEDITERKLNEKRFHDALETKDKFFSIIAHGIRSPLSELINISRELTENFNNITIKDMENFAKLFYNSSSNLFEYLDNLLKWSFSQIGVMKVNKENINLYEIVNDIFSIFNNAIDEKKLHIQNNIPYYFKIYTDKNIISTVLRNLISNAIKYSFFESRIEIFSRLIDNEYQNSISYDEAAYYEITIIDFGVGINDESKARLFKLDKLISTPGTANESGTGLGLILSKELIEKIDGSISFKSEFRKGTEFTVIIPK